MFLRRGWPGGSLYWTTVGGSVESDDADLDTAPRREVETVTVTQHYFLADLLDLRPERRSGPELDTPDTGDFDPVRIPLDATAVTALGLHPPELAAYLLEHVDAWRDR